MEQSSPRVTWPRVAEEKVYTVSHEISSKHLIRGRTTLATAIARTAAAGCRSSVALVWVAPAAG